jgi:hypothetical protein
LHADARRVSIKGFHFFSYKISSSSRAVVYLLRGYGIIIFSAQGLTQLSLSALAALMRFHEGVPKLIFQKQFAARWEKKHELCLSGQITRVI